MKISESYGLLKANPDRLFDTNEIIELFDKSKAWAERQRWAGTGPKYIKIGRTPYYRGSDLLKFIEGNSEN